jgi:hypothetical protein
MHQDVAPVVFVPYNLALTRSPQRCCLCREGCQHIGLPPLLAAPVILVFAQVEGIGCLYAREVDVAPFEPPGVAVRGSAPDINVIRAFVSIRDLVAVVRSGGGIPPVSLRPVPLRYSRSVIDDLDLGDPSADQVRLKCVLVR